MVTNEIVDIFDELEAETKKDPFEGVESTEEVAISNIKNHIATLLEGFDRKGRQASHARMTSELQDLVKSEIAKIKPVQNVIERTIEKQVKNIQVPIQVPPQIIKEIVKEVRIEAPKDSKVYAELASLEDLKKELKSLRALNENLTKRADQLQKQIKETQETLPFLHGGSGVIGLPKPDGNAGKTIQVVNNQWVPVTPSSGGGGLTPGTFTITNNTETYSLDATNSTVDTLYQIVATLVRKLQGEI